VLLPSSGLKCAVDITTHFNSKDGGSTAFEVLVSAHHTTQRSNPEDINLYFSLHFPRTRLSESMNSFANISKDVSPWTWRYACMRYHKFWLVILKHTLNHIRNKTHLTVSHTAQQHIQKIETVHMKLYLTFPYLTLLYFTHTTNPKIYISVSTSYSLFLVAINKLF